MFRQQKVCYLKTLHLINPYCKLETIIVLKQSLEEPLRYYFPRMNFVHFKLLAVCDNIENHVKVLKGFLRYHITIIWKVILCAILYQKPLIYLKKVPSYPPTWARKLSQSTLSLREVNKDWKGWQYFAIDLVFRGAIERLHPILAGL